MKPYEQRKLLYVHDGRLYIDENGNILGPINDLIRLKKRYSYLAPNVKFALRVVKLNESERGKYVNLKDYGINIVPIPDIASPKGLLFNRRKAKKVLKNAILLSDILILRNSTNAALAQLIAEKMKKPYIFEVVSCNWDALWNFSLIGKIYAPYAFLRMKYCNVAKAKYAIYVTKKFLQRRYPNNHTNVGISDVMLDPVDLSLKETKIQRYNQSGTPIILTTCAAIDVKYKGQEYIIRAIAKLREKYNIEYHLAGGGSANFLKSIAKECNIEDKVIFEGLLTKDMVNKLLDKTTIYCQPSKQEGLPRAVIEAMSRGCVCIGSRTGGIPELLDKSMIVGRGDVDGFVSLIDKILESKSLQIEQCTKNFNKALDFESDKLDRERQAFYDRFIKEN